jgi:hypothetical protein
VALSGPATAVKRARKGLATGAALSPRGSAVSRTCCTHGAAASVKRCSSAWGLIATPKVAAVWVSSSKEAWGWPRKPQTKVWVNVAPPSGEVRWTNRVVRAAFSAMVVKISRMVRATGGMVVMGKLLFEALCWL